MFAAGSAARAADTSDGAAKAQSFASIVQLLLSAGYFRARLKALSEFDRVVGGLCWQVCVSGTRR